MKFVTCLCLILCATQFALADDSCTSIIDPALHYYRGIQIGMTPWIKRIPPHSEPKGIYFDRLDILQEIKNDTEIYVQSQMQYFHRPNLTKIFGTWMPLYNETASFCEPADPCSFLYMLRKLFHISGECPISTGPGPDIPTLLIQKSCMQLKVDTAAPMLRTVFTVWENRSSTAKKLMYGEVYIKNGPNKTRTCEE
ncbi:uncharacterized protein [Fopius arisanus]|uniref:Uncharacterized protein n=1 Tax=Fopius arisanus TaxID=64838 RepID=A0A9R1TV60_9HYME|nr:PREDICTED: uncharacterized protein LOC105263098 [Fopius arisanus]